jgi:hypothetical protein
LGGQIRHSEIRSGAAVQNGNESGNENASQLNTQEKNPEDDD